jgi:uncharacterized protein
MSGRSDAELVATQLGRPPRGTWRVAARCNLDAPTVIAVAPILGDGTPFPTTFWLTCPLLVQEVHRLESGGAHAEWARRAGRDADLAAGLLTADAAYRAARAAEAGGVDLCANVGVAGQSDALQVKCLHARVAAHLAGLVDPIGQVVAAQLAGATLDCDGVCCGCGNGRVAL